jgi:hydroxymethylpyrimidine pyrophosphatase-like HAD family hydrolase
MFVPDACAQEKLKEQYKKALLQCLSFLRFLLKFPHQFTHNKIFIYKEFAEVRHLRTQDEVLQKVTAYKKKLAEAIQEKEEYPTTNYPELDLIIFSLVDKIEALLWVLEIDLPEEDILDRIEGLNH